VRLWRTHLPECLLEGVLLRAPCGFLLGRMQTGIRTGVGDGPLIERFDVLGSLLHLGILLFEFVAIAQQMHPSAPRVANLICSQL
jgi:hypothetical protein